MPSYPMFRENWLIATLIVVSLGGCKSEQLDPETIAMRQRVMLVDEPTGAITLTELAMQLGVLAPEAAAATDVGAVQDTTAMPDGPAADSSPESVVVVGRIFAGQMEPWEQGKAAFLLAELPDQGHGEGHDADNCPFCKRKAARAPTAIVQLVDDSGQVLAVDARKLLGVQSQDIVVIRGSAIPGEHNSLVITAHNLHIRRR
jgi:hypothetical protein